MKKKFVQVLILSFYIWTQIVWTVDSQNGTKLLLLIYIAPII